MLIRLLEHAALSPTIDEEQRDHWNEQLRMTESRQQVWGFETRSFIELERMIRDGMRDVSNNVHVQVAMH